MEQLQQWTERNPANFEKRPREHQKRDRQTDRQTDRQIETETDRQGETQREIYQARQLDSKLRNCVYCNKAHHKYTNCKLVTSINER